MIPAAQWRLMLFGLFLMSCVFMFFACVGYLVATVWSCLWTAGVPTLTLCESWATVSSLVPWR